MYYLLLATSILLAVVGQVLFKLGAAPGAPLLSLPLIELSLSKNTLLGLVFYFLSALLYIQVLKEIPLSVAYPSIALSYVAIAIISSVYFDETIHKGQAVGLLFIVMGVSMLWLKK